MRASPTDRSTADGGRSTIRAFEQSLPMALMRAREAVLRHFRPILADHDLTEQQWRVLRALDDASHPVSVGELADRTFLLGPSLSRMLTSLDDRGLVARTAGDDARRTEVSISGAGVALVARIGPLSEAVYDHIERQLGVGDLDRLTELLGRLAHVGDRPAEADMTAIGAAT